jgi:hypothetical protein
MARPRSRHEEGSGKTSIVVALTGDPRAASEPGYEPGNDIAYAERQAHFLLVTMNVADPLQDQVLSALKEIRLRHPSWPALVAQTALHALYPRGAVHPPEYPCGNRCRRANTAAGSPARPPISA